MTPARGRPRDHDAAARILKIATRRLLADGYHGFTIDSVAAEAEVAKTTLYRRWPTKDHLAVAVVAGLQDEVTITDSGDLAADLTAYLTAIASGLENMRRAGAAPDDPGSGGGTVAELVAATARHRDLGDLSRAQFRRRNTQAIALITRAVNDGRLHPDTDPEILFDELAGALYYRVLLTGAPIDPGYAARMVTQSLRGLLTSQAKETP